MNRGLLNKADVLLHLRNLLRKSIIDNIVVFAVNEWQSKREDILAEIQFSFSENQMVIIRSAAQDEDGLHMSLAGYYRTEMGIPSSNTSRLIQALESVMLSYSKNARVPSLNDKIIVQSQIKRVVYSGVVLTRDPRTDAPYYVINYDDVTGRTDTVTSGSSSRVLRVVHWLELSSLFFPWKDLLLAVREIEYIYPKDALDIEFGIDSANQIHIFQVRNLNITKSINAIDDSQIRAAVSQLKKSTVNLTSRVNRLAGNYTVLADMTDWNPAEILGSRPNILDRTLYRFLVTQSTWNQARASIGYTDVAPSELMITVANKPYIDTRTSFNSLTPAILRPRLREKLLNYYLDKLIMQPQLQDKVEFEIVFTCFDLSFEGRLPDLKKSGFSKMEITYLKRSLLSFTNNLLINSTNIINEDLNFIKQLGNLQSVELLHPTDPIGLLNQAYELLKSCRDLGVLPFARLARLAFVGLSLVRSLLKQEVINEAFFESFQRSIETITGQMNQDMWQIQNNLDDFVRKYGHLRAGTYNILAPRYDQRPNLFSSVETSLQKKMLKNQFVFDRMLLTKIDHSLTKHGIEYSSEALMDFTRQAIKYRELSKFEFSKVLSDALELIALAGDGLGFSREELALVDLEILIKASTMTSSDTEDVKYLLREAINANREARVIYEKIALPPVLIYNDDLETVSFYGAHPNFITHRSVEGLICNVNQAGDNNIPDVTDKIVILENADPGYDWIFTRHPRGLITKYGGPASHMAIRCAEFGLPAAIGCGEAIFDRLTIAYKVFIDCSTEKIIPLQPIYER